MKAKTADNLQRGQHITCCVGGHFQVARVHGVHRSRDTRHITCFFMRKDGMVCEHVVRHLSAYIVTDEELALLRSQDEFKGRLDFDVPNPQIHKNWPFNAR